MNDKKIIDKKEVYNNFLDRAVNMAKQGKRQNILTPGFYDAVRIGKSFFDLSQEEVYDEIERRLNGEMQELIVPEASEEDLQRQKEMNKELETTKKTSKEIQDLQTEADDEDIKRAQDLNKELETTKKHADDLKKAGDEGSLTEKIAQKVREKLNKKTMKEATKEEETEFHKKLDKLVHDTFGKRKEELGEAVTDLKVGDRVIYDRTGEEFEVIEVNTDRLVTGRDRQGEQKILTTRHISKVDEIKEALESMGTADEDTMKYLLQDIGREELVNFEKQFVIMFDLLTDIRYDGSEQLSKGASEISQRIHNFITIFRQALKGYPVVKEDNTESLTNNHSNPVTEAAKKKLVGLINSIALKEGISKKEATIKAIKALQESK